MNDVQVLIELSNDTHSLLSIPIAGSVRNVFDIIGLHFLWLKHFVVIEKDENVKFYVKTWIYCICIFLF